MDDEASNPWHHLQLEFGMYVETGHRPTPLDSMNDLMQFLVHIGELSAVPLASSYV
jgi:hypothetical protein